MLPEGVLASQPVRGEFLYQWKGPLDFLRDWELGGIDLNDTSEGLLYQTWQIRGIEEEGGDIRVDVVAGTTGVEHTLFAFPGITDLALAFDQNMNPFVAYMRDGAPWIYWYDSLAEDMVHTALPADCYDLRCAMDERRGFNSGQSDIILSYIRGTALCVRYQRDRYGVEYVLHPNVGPDTRLVAAARSSAFRFQWLIRNSILAPIIDPGDGPGSPAPIPGDFPAVDGAFLDMHMELEVRDSVFRVPEWMPIWDPTIMEKLVVCVGEGPMQNEPLGIVEVRGTAIQVDSTYPNGKVRVGIPFRSSVRTSPLTYLDHQERPVETGKYTVLRYILGTANTGEFEVTLTGGPQSAATGSDFEAAGLTWSSSELRPGAPLEAPQGLTVVPARVDARKAELEVSADGVRELNLVSVDYVGRYNQKIRRR